MNHPLPEPPPGWPATPVEPTAVYPRAAAPIERYGQQADIVYVPDPYNPHAFVAVRRTDLPTMPPAPQPPAPTFDPRAQIILATGIGGGALGAGAGWGVGEAAGGLAGGGAGGLVLILALLLALKLAGRRGGGTVNNVTQHVTNNIRPFGKSTTHM